MTKETILLILSIVGVLNGIVFGVILLFTSIGKRKANLFLGLFILFLSIRYLRSVHYFVFSEYNHALFLVSSVFFLLLGPCLYAYVRSYLSDSFTLKLRSILHLLVLSPIIFLLIEFEKDLPIFRIITFSSLAILLAYSIFSLIKLLKIKKGIPNKNILLHDINWVRNLLLLVIINVLLYFVNLNYRFAASIFGATSYTIILYAISIYWGKIQFSKKQKRSLEKYKNSVYDDIQVKELIDQLLMKIEKEELYKDYDITLPKLAENLAIPQHYLSMIINKNLNKNFSEFINDYRIKEACKMLESDQYSNESVQAIAYESGFNSMSVFYDHFKKSKGITPTKYRKSNKNNPIL